MDTKDNELLGGESKPLTGSNLDEDLPIERVDLMETLRVIQKEKNERIRQAFRDGKVNKSSPSKNTSGTECPKQLNQNERFDLFMREKYPNYTRGKCIVTFRPSNVEGSDKDDPYNDNLDMDQQSQEYWDSIDPYAE